MPAEKRREKVRKNYMSQDEIQNLATAVGELIKVQRTDHRRIERLEQAFLDINQLLLRQDEREDNWEDWRIGVDQWRIGVDQWRREAEEHHKNTEAHIAVLGELTIENARGLADLRRTVKESGQRVDQRLDQLGQQVDQRLDQLGQRLDQLGQRLDQLTGVVERLAGPKDAS